MELSHRRYYAIGYSLLFIGGTGILLYPILTRTRENAKKSSCQSNLKQIALGIFQYTQDWDEKYPVIAVKDTKISPENPYGWSDALQPYLKSSSIFHCPDHPLYKNKSRPTQPQAKGFNDYYFNSRLAGVSQAKVKDVKASILMGHGNDGMDYSNARYSKNKLPARWRGDETSPARHHLGGTNYAFADGHVKWVKPEGVSNNRNGRYTFANP